MGNSLLARPVEWLRAQMRAFVLGPAVVERTAMAWGHSSPFNVPEYGDYLVTSNGVYACATGRADLLAGLKLRAYKRNARGQAVEVTGGKLYELLQKVNPHWTMRRLLYMSELARCLWGESFWFYERGQSGRLPPREIWWARSDRVRLLPDPVQYIRGYVYEPTTGSTPIPYLPGEVLWMPFPNPLDEFQGLSPIAAARLGADYATAAMRSNRNLFTNGMQMGGLVMPKQGNTLTPEQQDDIELRLARRLKGEDNAHRWGVLGFEAQVNNMEGLSPKDAEFLGGLRWSLEDICRAYKWPLDLVGGQRTFENLNSALKAAYTHAVLPEAEVMSADMTEQLVPLFPGEVDYVAFDTSLVEVLQEDRAEIVDQIERLTRVGVPLNKLLAHYLPQLLAEGGQGYAWGNVWWAPMGVMPVDSDAAPVPPAPAPAEVPAGGAATGNAAHTRDGGEEEDPWAFESENHRAAWSAWAARADKQEESFGKVVAGLLSSQRVSLLDKLAQRGRGRGYKPLTQQRDVTDDLLSDAELREWIRKFRERARPALRGLVAEAGADAVKDLGVSLDFSLTEPAVIRFLEQRAQRFAKRVNDTTWAMLRESLAEGVKDGEGIDQLAERVQTIMAGRIQSSKETIARTEVVGANNGGTLLAWQQAKDVVGGKRWLATLDGRTRDSHQAAHNQVVGLDEDFTVGGARGPAPGQMGQAEEDVNCRCTMVAVLKE